MKDKLQHLESKLAQEEKLISINKEELAMKTAEYEGKLKTQQQAIESEHQKAQAAQQKLAQEKQAQQAQFTQQIN